MDTIGAAARWGGCERRKGKLLRHLYIGFPGGVPGLALTILRAVLGVAVIVQGERYLTSENAVWAAWFGGALLLGCGGFLLLGLLTPLAVILTLLWEIAVKLSLVPPATPKVFESPLSVAFGLTILLAIAGMGPGAYSMDARLFGRKEIIIPRPRS